MIKTSPIPEFPGTITLPEHLNLAQCLEYEDGITAAKEYIDNGGKSLTKINACYLPIFDACIVAREIAGWADDYPMTPRLASAGLANWIIGELKRMYSGEIEIPNEQRPEPTPPQTEPANAQS